MVWIVQCLGILVVLGLSPLAWGITQTTKARMQGRLGPPILQTYWTIAKNWGKQTTVPEYSSFVFRLAPSVSLAALIVVLTTIPVAGRAPGVWPDNLLSLFFLLALERFWTGLAGLDTAGTFGGMGASRVTTLGAGVEPALLAAVAIVWRVSGHTAILPLATVFPQNASRLLPWALGSLSLVVASLAELGRLPVDNPDTHLELTMIHEATLLEYNGRLLALNQWAMAVKMTALITLAWVIFGPDLASLWANLGLRVIEVLVTAGGLGLIESRFSKLRYFQLPAYLALAAGIGMLAFYLSAGGLIL